MTLMTASSRVLILTNLEFYAIFTRTTAGQIAECVRVELLALPPEMQSAVDGITRRASEEMGLDVVAAASAVQAEEAGERGEDVPPRFQ